MDRFQERIEQADKALAALLELTEVLAPTLVQRDALLLRFMLASEAIWKAVLHAGRAISLPTAR